MDYAQARYYNKQHGRFTSVDPIKMKEDRKLDPQRINLFAYVRNNPLAFTDKTGLDLTFEFQYDAEGNITNLKEAKKYKKYLESTTTLKLNLNETTGQITIEKERDYTTKVSNKIKTIIEDSSADIRIASSNGDTTVVGGRFDGGGHQTIDFDDLGKLDEGKGFTKESIVIHETVEAYEGRNTARGTPLTAQFHNTAID